MRQIFTKFTRRLIKRGQSGQSIVILALAFVALLAFVGIVTDISLLFVRFSTLQRALDSASVAAATQMRRVLDENPDPDIDTGSSTSYASMNLAARAFIESYGLSPEKVIVETCHAQVIPHDVDGNPIFGPVPDWYDTAEEAEASYNELCTEDQRKLVRVSAQLTSPTVFLRVLGFQDFELTASAISETAVLDVVMILDVSESMRDDTTPETYTDNLTELQSAYSPADPEYAKYDPTPWNIRYLPGRVPTFNYDGSPTQQWWQTAAGGLPDLGTGLMQLPQSEIDEWLLNNAQDSYTFFDYSPPAGAYWFENVYYPRHRPFELGDTWPTTAFDLDDVYSTGSSPTQPRYECRVQFWPFAHRSEVIQDEVLDEYVDYLATNTQRKEYFNVPPALTFDTDDDDIRSYYLTYRGFAPTYNFYGCCNDPNGDGEFDDLVCEPFKTARDETINFLDRVDFLRGDRVAFVTFDRRAYLFDVNGDATAGGFMIDNQIDAEAILRESIGVRAEPTFYADMDDTDDIAIPRWDRFVIGSDSNGTFDTSDDITLVNRYRYNRLDTHTNPGGAMGVDGEQDMSFARTAVGNRNTFAVLNNCPFDLAALRYPYSNYGPKPGFPAGEALLQPLVQPSWITNPGVVPSTPPDLEKIWSYDFRGSCAGTNIGAALAAASEALGRPVDAGGGRREGAVWIMVLLGDGAAGASNPVPQDGAVNPLTQPYMFVGDNDGDGFPDPAPDFDRQGGYGSFGVCPAGDVASPAELLRDGEFPYCSDIRPEERHFCVTSGSYLDGIPNNPNQLDLNNDPVPCIQRYDVDDYARDWADFVAGVTLPSTDTTQLPTIFTIGFGLEFENPGCVGINTCTEQYLGEELLRYIADAGDNNRIDNDYWQTTLAISEVVEYPPAPFDETDPADQAEFYGQIGQCEEDDGDVFAWSPLPPGTSCGNYFNVSGSNTGAQLEFVFNEIASRMFTRLSQ